MAKFKTRQEFDAHLAKVQADREQFVKREREALGRAAEKAGVLELGFTEEQLEQAFGKMVRESRASPVQAPTAKRRAGAAAELEAPDAK